MSRRFVAVRWLALVLVLVVVALRLVMLDQYPRVDPDEGYWASGARNYALFGQPLMDGRMHPFLSPATFVGLSGLFALVRPTLYTARLFAAVMGLLACLLAWHLGRRQFSSPAADVQPGRPWLVLLLFGLSAQTVVVQRTIRLESHQIFWLFLAAVLWLSRRRGAALWAGAAYGVALLVKSNSLYLLPAFLVSLPASARPDGTARDWLGFGHWRRAVGLVVACGVVAGGGYLAAWALDPAGFAQAFRFELDGRHFLGDHVIVHVGRFGLSTQHAGEIGRFILNDPILLGLAGVGLVHVLRNLGRANQADRLFSAWMMLGLAFNTLQIYTAFRYFTTITPAFAYLGARTLERWLYDAAPGGPRGAMRRVGMGIIAAFVVLHGIHFARGLRERANPEYWEAVGWIGTHIPQDAPILAAPYLGLSLPQRSYDFFRLLFPYGDEDHPRALAPVVDAHGIAYIVVDSEWREYAKPEMRAFVAARGRTIKSFTTIEVVAVIPARPGP